MKKTVIVFLALFAVIPMIKAQKIVLKSGDLSVIKDEKFFDIEYDYSNMGVGKYDKEEDYVAQKVNDYNEKEPGRGDKWKESWIGDRKARFQPMFEELLNKYLNKADVFVGPENTDAKYKFILSTTFTEPGYNVYVSKKNAMINVELRIVERANPDNVVAYIISKNNPGRTAGGADYDTGLRISEAYAKCGKELGNYLYKKVWK